MNKEIPMLIKKLIIITLLIFSTISSFANLDLPKINPIPGGIVKLPLNLNGTQTPQVYYQNHRVIVLSNKNKRWLAIVGIPLSAKPGKQSVNIRLPINQDKFFKIKKKYYQLQRIQIKNKRYIQPNLADQARIEKENKQIETFISHWSNINPFKHFFIAPVHGKISSRFGLRRILNGKPHEPHQGIDIAAAAGTVVHAPLAGVVLGVGDYFYSGNTIFIDHGQGLITLYAHLKSINVKPHHYIPQGKTIGTVGKTGRATGAHLHWGVILNKVKVNPLLFIAKKQITK